MKQSVFAVLATLFLLTACSKQGAIKPGVPAKNDSTKQDPANAVKGASDSLYTAGGAAHF